MNAKHIKSHRLMIKNWYANCQHYLAFFTLVSASCLPSCLSGLLVSHSFSLCPFLSVQAVSGISRPLQEPAGSPFASEPAGVWRPAFLWPSQPREDTAGHGERDCPAWLELPLPWPGARPSVLQVSQWTIRGMCLKVACLWISVTTRYACICSCVAWTHASILPSRQRGDGLQKWIKGKAPYFLRN